MKKIVEICYSNSMKINRGQYEQEAPFYSAKTILEENGQVIDEVAEYGRLRSIIDPLLITQYQDAKLSLSNLRIRVKDGKKYPSVTSILSPDGIPASISPNYAKRGTEIHRLVNVCFETGVWEEPMGDISPLKWTDIKYKEFFKDHAKRMQAKHLNLEIFHKKHMFSGEIDFYGMVDDKLTVLDFKTGEFKWEQLVAYAKCVETFQIAVADLKNNELIIKTPKECQDYWENFLVLRGQFKSRFGI